MTCLSGFYIEMYLCESYRNIYCWIELFETGHLPILNDLACLIFNIEYWGGGGGDKIRA